MAVAIGSITDNRAEYAGSNIPKYEKYEATFSISGIGTHGTTSNFYNPNLNSLGTDRWYKLRGVCVDAIITDPDSTVLEWPCYYNGTTWKFRFTPKTTGSWSYYIRVKYRNETKTSSSVSFTAVANSDPLVSRGFVVGDTTDPTCWKFSESGEQFHPIGCMVTSATDIANLGAAGGTFQRVFYAAKMFEQSYHHSRSDDRCCKYLEDKAEYWDEFFVNCRNAGIYVIVLLQDWTRWNSSTYNPYIVEGVCDDVDDSFVEPRVREVMKRKIRYWIARWGYSVNLIGFDFMNEVAHGSSECRDMHSDLANFVKGDDAAIPADWAITENWFGYLRQLQFSGDLTSSRWEISSVPWDDADITFTQYHDYGRIRANGTYLSWTGLISEHGEWERMGSSNIAPWVDTAVWMDRMCRVVRRSYATAPAYGTKHFSWNEFGLIYIESSGAWKDWNAAYSGDTNAQHAHDWLWAGLFNKAGVCHWKAEVFNGGYGSVKWNAIYKPLHNYLYDSNCVVDTRGLTQQTIYSVSDPLNPTPTITCSNSNIEVYSLTGSNVAYLYVKNKTSTWYYSAGKPGGYPAPTPAVQSATIVVSGLATGTYCVEKWSTVDTNPATQKVSSEIVSITSPDDITLSVSLGGTSDYDCAYKIYDVTADPPVSGVYESSLTEMYQMTDSLAAEVILHRQEQDRYGFNDWMALEVEAVPGTAVKGKLYLDLTTSSFGQKVSTEFRRTLASAGMVNKVIPRISDVSGDVTFEVPVSSADKIAYAAFGSPVSTTADGAMYVHVFKNEVNKRKTLTIVQRWGEYYRLSNGVVITKLSLRAALDNAFMATMSLAGRDMAYQLDTWPDVDTEWLDNAAYDAVGSFEDYHIGVYMEGAASDAVDDVTIDIERTSRRKRRIGSGRTMQDSRVTDNVVNIRCNLYFTSDRERYRLLGYTNAPAAPYRIASASQPQSTMAVEAINGDYKFRIDVPDMRLVEVSDAEYIDDIIKVPVVYRAKYDATEGTDLVVTVVSDNATMSDGSGAEVSSNYLPSSFG